MAIDIVKLATGNVAIYDATSNVFIKSLSPDIVEIECNEQGIVKVIEDNGKVDYFDPNEVNSTRVLPAAAIPFVGNCVALAELLATDFFFVSSGGGDAIDINYDNSVSGLAATNVQDAIDEVDTFVPKNFYLSGTYNAFYKSSAISGNFGINPTIFWQYGFYILSTVEIDKIRFVTYTNPVGQVGFGLYNSLGQKLTDVAFDSSLPAGIQVLNLPNPIKLNPGFYFWGMSNVGNVAMALVNSSASNTDNIFSNSGFDANNNTISNARYKTGYTHIFPMPAVMPTYDTLDTSNVRFLIQNYIV